MFKTILRQVKQYRTAAILTPVWTAAEVVMGVLIPYVTASIIDKGINAGSMPGYSGRAVCGLFFHRHCCQPEGCHVPQYPEVLVF